MNGSVTIAIPGTTLAPRYLPSGLRFYDARTGGLRAGKRYVFGAPRGADASVLALQVAFAGLRAGEVVLVVSAEDPEALVMHGERAGLPLARFLFGEQCLLLGYDRRFGERAANPALAGGMLRDLQRKTNERPLHRVVLLDEPVAGGVTAKVREALELIDGHVREKHGAVVVHVADPRSPGAEERHAELQRTAFGACLIEPEDAGRQLYGRFRLLKDPALAGGAATGRLAIRPGEGFVEVEADVEAASVVYVGSEERLSGLREGLGAEFRVIAHEPDGGQPLPPGLPASALIVVEADAASPQALALVDRIRRAEPTAPLLAVTRQPGRSADRVRLLRHGVDDVLARDTPLAEMRAHLRRHAARIGLLPAAPPEVPRADAGPREVASWGAFGRATAEHAQALGRGGDEFALVSLSLGEAAAASAIERAASALARCLRADDGCAVSPDGVVVARLGRVGKADAEAMVVRVGERLAGSPALGGLEPKWAAVVCPHDGRDFEALYLRLVRPEGHRARNAQEAVRA
jgi:hypothetical protein